MLTTTKSPRDKIVVRTNQCTAPIGDSWAQSTGWTNLWFGAGGAGTNAVATGSISKTWTTRPTSVADVGWSYTDTSWPAGGFRHVLARIYCNGFTGRAMIRCTFYNSSGTQLAQNASTPTSLVAGFAVAFEGVFQSPAGTASVKIEIVLVDNGNIPNVNNGIALSHVLIEDGNISGTDRYFDGTTYSAGFGTLSTSWEGTAFTSRSLMRDFDPANVVSPLLVLGWDQQGNGETAVVHRLLSGAVQVVTRQGTPRSGTLKLFFGPDRAAAFTCAAQHRKAGVWVYSDTDLPETNLTYAVTGPVRAYNSDARTTWTVEVPFSETS